MAHELRPNVRKDFNLEIARLISRNKKGFFAEITTGEGVGQIFFISKKILGRDEKLVATKEDGQDIFLLEFLLQNTITNLRQVEGYDSEKVGKMVLSNLEIQPNNDRLLNLGVSEEDIDHFNVRHNIAIAGCLNLDGYEDSVSLPLRRVIKVLVLHSQGFSLEDIFDGFGMDWSTSKKEYEAITGKYFNVGFIQFVEKQYFDNNK
jgi:hypothetical protein